MVLGNATAHAQSTTTSRAEVKAEARKAQRVGDIPTGEQGSKDRPFTATQTRADRKVKTRNDIAKGDVIARGEANAPTRPAKVSKTSGTPRAEVKADARAANKSGATRVGESYPDKNR